MTDIPYFDLRGKVALVTGASSGLGRHFAKTLARAGAEVGIAARRRDRLEALARDAEGRMIPVKMDVTDPGSVAAGLDEIEGETGLPVSILVNNAGIADATGFLKAERENTEVVFATNQMAVFELAQAVSRRLVDKGIGGSIINIASIAGLRAMGGAAAYAASKAAVAHLTRVQALELARYGIRANAIAPGYVETEINQAFLRSETGQALIQRIPMRRTGEVDELDALLLLLASDRGSYITGAVIPVDGGHLTSSL
ncbi:SDR family NAD(P)-dependent oxidoreductase [Alphaproteobacteria bacterium LSUCC0684]